jgi:glycosyltransferase involved in cell wall biosynthesis
MFRRSRAIRIHPGLGGAPVNRSVALLAPRGTVLTEGAQGGSSVVLMEDREILSRAGWDVRVFAHKTGGTAQATILECKTIPLVGSMEYCGAFVRASQDCALVAYNEPTVALLAPASSIVRFDWHTPLPRYWGIPWAKQRFSRSRYLFPSQALRKLWLGQHHSLPVRSVVMPNAVDLHLFSPPVTPGPTETVGFAGQWIPAKGLGTLLDAWPIVRARMPNATLLLAGGSDLWHRTRPAPGSREIDPRVASMADCGVRNVGVLPRDAMPRFWADVTVACVPSSSEEPFGLVALEAMACSVPVVHTDRGALPEVVGDAGMSVAAEDPPALASALIQLLSSPQMVQELGVRARGRALSFSLARRERALTALVEEVSR